VEKRVSPSFFTVTLHAMAPHKVGLLAVTVLAALGLWLSTRFIDYPFLEHRGQVLDWRTKQPIAGATVRIDCYVTRRVHGSDLERSVQATSAADGAYHFASRANQGCSFIGVHPSREGYIDAMDAGLNIVEMGMSAEIPKFVWMVAEGDRKQLRLEALLSNSNSQRVSPPGPMPLEDYTTVAIPFAESKQLATDAADISWLRTNYCGRLRALYAKVPPADRGKLGRLASQVEPYESGVELFCLAPGEFGAFTRVEYLGDHPRQVQARFDGEKGLYTLDVTGAREPAGADHFGFLWRQASGNLSIAADIGQGRGGLMLRSSPGSNPVYAAALVRAGRLYLQYAASQGSEIVTIRCGIDAPTRVRLERQGESVVLAVPQDGGMRPACSAHVPFGDDYLVGLVVAPAPDQQDLEARFSNVVLSTPPLVPGNGAGFEVVTLDSHERHAVFHGDSTTQVWFAPDSRTLCVRGWHDEAARRIGDDAARVSADACGAGPPPYVADAYEQSIVDGRVELTVRSPQQYVSTFYRDEYSNWNAVPSPDGRTLVFLSRPPSPDDAWEPGAGEYMLRVMPVSGGTPRVLARFQSGEQPGLPQFSPDGTRVLIRTGVPPAWVKPGTY